MRDLDEPIVVLLSAIEHYSYCPRQCALIHVERVWTENVYTVRGNIAHERVDSGAADVRKGVKAVRDVPVWSDTLHIRGKADMVEFRGDVPYPVEYKVGKQRGHHADLQLCAQALCLEEMLGIDVPEGAIFYHAERRRQKVAFDTTLRTQTREVIIAIRAVMHAQQLPTAPNDQRCHHCSLKVNCMPSVVAEPTRLRGLQGALFVPYDSITE